MEPPQIKSRFPRLPPQLRKVEKYNSLRGVTKFLPLSLATRKSSEVKGGGGVVVVAGAQGELLELGGELGEVGVVVSVERGVDVVGHVPGAVVKVACNCHIFK